MKILFLAGFSILIRLRENVASRDLFVVDPRNLFTKMLLQAGRNVKRTLKILAIAIHLQILVAVIVTSCFKIWSELVHNFILFDLAVSYLETY